MKWLSLFSKLPDTIDTATPGCISEGDKLAANCRVKDGVRGAAENTYTIERTYAVIMDSATYKPYNCINTSVMNAWRVLHRIVGTMVTTNTRDYSRINKCATLERQAGVYLFTVG